MEFMVKKFLITILTFVIFLSFPFFSYADIDGKPFNPPVSSGTITSLYGKRSLFGRSFHYGIDIAVPVGTPVRAAQDGRVTISSYRGGYGYLVELKHEGELNYFHTRYGHNSRLVVKVGDYVNKGEIIAYSGNTGDSTGPHVHYEVRRSNTPIDPLIHTDFSGFDHTGVPNVSLSNVVDYIVMGIENSVVIFFNIMEEKAIHPFMANLPMIVQVDLDISKALIVQQIHKIIGFIAKMFMPFTIFFYIAKMTALNLLGEQREFIKETLFKSCKAGILIEFSLFFCGMFLGIATSIIMAFAEFVDSDYSKIMYSYETVMELFSAAGINAFLVILNFFVYLILIVVIFVRIIDIALLTVLTPLMIPFGEFADRSLYSRFLQLYVSIPVAQFLTVLCFAFAIGFAEISTPTLQSLGFLGKGIISLASAIYALLHPETLKRMFQLNSIQAIDSMLIAGKSLMVVSKDNLDIKEHTA